MGFEGKDETILVTSRTGDKDMDYVMEHYRCHMRAESSVNDCHRRESGTANAVPSSLSEESQREVQRAKG
jgi:hypothetical protein